MKLKEFVLLRDEGGFTTTARWHEVDAEIREAIQAVVWPPESQTFVICPKKHGSGVGPIKTAFVTLLTAFGWKHERRALIDGTGPGPIDALKDFSDGDTFICEWETGNVSSSHRALNKMVVAMKEDNIIGGVLVVPDRALAKYLTDRIGNFEELEPYFSHWGQASLGGEGMLGIYVVTYDGTSLDVPQIDKLTDGRALI